MDLDLQAEVVVGVRASATAAVELDLGAIGKGFALDHLAELLVEDWEITDFLLDAGGSTALARGGRTWSVAVGGNWGPRAGFDVITLHDGAVSGSGVEVQGQHVRDVRAAVDAPARHAAAWALAPSAASADALSTAFMILDRPQVEGICHGTSATGALMIDPDGRTLRATAAFLEQRVVMPA
jgi:thiamine biosynthesis lipoprotein